MRIRGRLINTIKPRFSTLDEAEDHYKQLVDKEAEEVGSSSRRSVGTNINLPTPSSQQDWEPLEETCNLSSSTSVALNGFAKEISAASILQVIKYLITLINQDDSLTLADSLWINLVHLNNIHNNPADFISLSLKAMIILMHANKSNLLYTFAYCIATKRSDSKEPLMPLNRMPFGSVEYQLEFFSCTNISQVQ